MHEVKRETDTAAERMVSLRQRCRVEKSAERNKQEKKKEKELCSGVLVALDL